MHFHCPISLRRFRVFKKRYLAEQWEHTCKAAGIVDLHFHDLRGTTVTMLAEAGCTLPEIASLTGHSLRRAQEILDKYLARTSDLDLFGTLIDRAGFRARLIHEYSIFIESLIIYELRAR